MDQFHISVIMLLIVIIVLLSNQLVLYLYICMEIITPVKLDITYC